LPEVTFTDLENLIDCLEVLLRLAAIEVHAIEGISRVQPVPELQFSFIGILTFEAHELLVSNFELLLCQRAADHGIIQRSSADDLIKKSLLLLGVET